MDDIILNLLQKINRRITLKSLIFLLILATFAIFTLFRLHLVENSISRGNLVITKDNEPKYRFVSAQKARVYYDLTCAPDKVFESNYRLFLSHREALGYGLTYSKTCKSNTSE